jgi:hypothetical protein
MHPTLYRIPRLLTIGEVPEGSQLHQAEMYLPINILETSISFPVYLIMHMRRRSLENFRALMVCLMFKRLCSRDFMLAN